MPEWVDLVKTAKSKELAPYDPDWYYIRAGESPIETLLSLVAIIMIDSSKTCKSLVGVKIQSLNVIEKCTEGGFCLHM